MAVRGFSKARRVKTGPAFYQRCYLGGRYRYKMVILAITFLCLEGWFESFNIMSYCFKEYLSSFFVGFFKYKTEMFI